RLMVSQKGQSAEHDSFDREASGVSRAGPAVFLPGRRERARPLWRQWLDFDCGRANWAASVLDGVGPLVRRRDRPALRALYRPEGQMNQHWTTGKCSVIATLVAVCCLSMIEDPSHAWPQAHTYQTESHPRQPRQAAAQR